MTKKKSKQESSFNYLLLPVMAFAFVPTVLKAHVLQSRLTGYQWFSKTQYMVDVDTFSKAVAMYVLVGFMGLMLLFAGMNSMVSFEKLEVPADKKKLFTKWYTFLAVSFVLTLVSTIFSRWAIFGFAEGMLFSYENIWSILCYYSVAVYTFLVISQEKDLKLLQWPLLASEFVVIAVGVSQAAGHSIFNNEFFKSIIIPEKYRSNINLGDVTGTDSVFSTLMNPNYVGVYVTLMVPIALALVVANKNILVKLLWLLDIAGLFYVVYKANNKSFLVALAGVAGLFVLIIIIKYAKTKPLISIGIVVAAVIAAVCVMFVFRAKISVIFDSLKSTSSCYLEEMTFDEEGMHISYKGQRMTVGYELYEDGAAMWAKDENGNYYTAENSWFSMQLYVTGEDDVSAEVPYFASLYINDPDSMGGIDFFRNPEDGKYYYVTKDRRIGYDIVTTPLWLFRNKISLATYRGAIWGKTLPLCAKHTLLGSGADTFALEFPNNDYAFKWNAHMKDQTLTGPHNWYMQMWVQQGGLSCLCVLAVLVIYLIGSLKLYGKAGDGSFTYKLGFGVMMGIVGYCIMGITNDSVMVTAPVFWMMMGVGFAINRMVEVRK